jgi:polysaccharide biosynthesis/export protein
MHKSYKAIASRRGISRVLSFLALLLIGGAANDTALAGSNVIESNAESYLIQPGDLLQVSVWKEQDLQGEILVRPDGGLSFPLAGDVAAEGKTVTELQSLLTERLRKYIPDPVVTILVKAAGGSRIYVLGKVNRPGEYPLYRPLDVMQALSLAGGTTPFAAVNDIAILRREGGKQRAIGFRYGDVEKGKALDQNLLLKSGDTVVVP